MLSKNTTLLNFLREKCGTHFYKKILPSIKFFNYLENFLKHLTSTIKSFFTFWLILFAKALKGLNLAKHILK